MNPAREWVTCPKCSGRRQPATPLHTHDRRLEAPCGHCAGTGRVPATHTRDGKLRPARGTRAS